MAMEDNIKTSKEDTADSIRKTFDAYGFSKLFTRNFVVGVMVVFLGAIIWLAKEVNYLNKEVINTKEEKVIIQQQLFDRLMNATLNAIQPDVTELKDKVDSATTKLDTATHAINKATFLLKEKGGKR
jgi:uncharacterized protein YlxW (UPF0749 family)